MNTIPFPLIYPRLTDAKWFNPDSPCDEDAELTALERAHQAKMNAIGQQYSEIQPWGKIFHEPMDAEADTDEDANDESDDSETSEEEDTIDIRSTPDRDINEMEVNNIDDGETEDVEVVEDVDSPDLSVVYSSP